MVLLVSIMYRKMYGSTSKYIMYRKMYGSASKYNV